MLDEHHSRSPPVQGADAESFGAIQSSNMNRNTPNDTDVDGAMHHPTGEGTSSHQSGLAVYTSPGGLDRPHHDSASGALLTSEGDSVHHSVHGSVNGDNGNENSERWFQKTPRSEPSESHVDLTLADFRLLDWLVEQDTSFTAEHALEFLRSAEEPQQEIRSEVGSIRAKTPSRSEISALDAAERQRQTEIEPLDFTPAPTMSRREFFQRVARARTPEWLSDGVSYRATTEERELEANMIFYGALTPTPSDVGGNGIGVEYSDHNQEPVLQSLGDAADGNASEVETDEETTPTKASARHGYTNHALDATPTRRSVRLAAAYSREDSLPAVQKPTRTAQRASSPSSAAGARYSTRVIQHGGSSNKSNEQDFVASSSKQRPTSRKSRKL